MSSLEKLRSDAMRGKWSEVLETYSTERALRTERITATGDTVLHMAVYNGREKVVANMVDLVLNENNVPGTVEEDGEESSYVNDVLGAENDIKNTPLHLAAIKGNVEMCKKIGKTNRSLIASRNINGETPLFLAALNGWKEVFLWLHYLYVENHGASPIGIAHCIRDNDDTILYCAIAQEHIDVAIEIIYLYDDLLRDMRRDKKGWSSLHLFASKRSAFKTTGFLELAIPLRLIYWSREVEEKQHATTFEELKGGSREVEEKQHAITFKD